jgi:hypothetical protein
VLDLSTLRRAVTGLAPALTQGCTLGVVGLEREERAGADVARRRARTQLEFAGLGDPPRSLGIPVRERARLERELHGLRLARLEPELRERAQLLLRTRGSREVTSRT